MRANLNRITLAIALPILVMASGSAGQASEIAFISMSFETSGLDLDSGALTITNASDGCQGDIRIAYNALRRPAAVVAGCGSGAVEMAFVSGIAFDGVTAELLGTLVFSTGPIDLPFSAAHTVVVRTDTGTIFKLGNAIESDSSVTFSYAAF